MSDPRLIYPMVLGWLPYFDEVVLAHPFIHPLHIRPEYSPTSLPSQHKEQTLKNVLLLMTLEPFIHAGYVHLIPDPGDFDHQFKATILQLAKERTAGWKPPKKLAGWQKAIADDDYRRMILRGSEAPLRRSIHQQKPQASDAEIDAVVAYAKSQLEADPYALLQPVEPGEAGAQLHIFKGFNLATAMFLAALTGSAVYTDDDTHWQHLHLHARSVCPAPRADWAYAAEASRGVEFTIELDAQMLLEALRAGRFMRMKGELRPLVDARQQQARAPRPDQIASRIAKAVESMRNSWSNLPSEHRLAGRIELSVPESGFDRNEVRRLLLTFGRAKCIRPLAAAILIRFEEVGAHVDDVVKAQHENTM